MIIISCVNCGKPITVDHKYKLMVDGGVGHVDCAAPEGIDQVAGKQVSFVTSKEDGSRSGDR